MNFSLSAKEEIARGSSDLGCCRRAFLSALVHSGGTLSFSHSGMSIMLAVIVQPLRQKLPDLFAEFADGITVRNDGNDTIIEGKNLVPALFALGVFTKDGDETVVESGIMPPLVKTDCCAVNYLRGAFLGAGSVSLTAGYHLEFALSSKRLAEDIRDLLARFGIMSRALERKEKTVVYIKENEAVSDCLALFGASEAVIELNTSYAVRQVRRRENRRTNCEIANITKMVNAAVRQNSDIRYIDSKVGLASLPEKLRVVAEARLANPEVSYATLASELGLNKSTLKNRLARLGKIADSIRGKED